jgi:gamma-F420-2:alpha-L-glutamate ligase
MRGWLLFDREVADGVPEAGEIRRFVDVAKRRNIKIDVLRPRDFELIVSTERAWRAEYARGRLSRPDFIIPRTGSETTYFTLAVIRQFERMGVPLINGAEAVEACADKLQTLQLLSASGLPIPKTILAKFPVDVKKLRSTRGAGVVLCQDREQFDDLASLLGDAGHQSDFIFQQYIAKSHGRDVRLLVIGGKVVASMERRALNGNFKSNISLGGSGECINAPEEMAKLALDAAKSLNLDIAGIDVLYDEKGYRICEANSAPGFVGLEKACPVSVPDQVFDYVAARLNRSTPLKLPFWKRLLGGARKQKTREKVDS